MDGNRLRSHQAEHLAEQFLVDTLQPGRIQLISQNLDGLDKPDGYDCLIETLGHHLTAAPHHVVVTFAEDIFFVVQLELLIMLCVELHDPDRIIPVLGLAGGLVDQGGNQSHHNSPVAIEGNPNAVLRLIPIDFPADNTAVFLRRVQVKDQAAAIVVAEVMVTPSAQLLRGIGKAGHKCIDIFLHDFKRLLVHLQPHQLLKPIVYIIHKSPPIGDGYPFFTRNIPVSSWIDIPLGSV